MPTQAAGALALAFSLLMQDDGLVFEARVDKKNQVFVDVKNPTAGLVRVTMIRVSFFDGDDHVIDRISVDCDDDCDVAASATESFGPIDGPRGWRNVRAMEVLFKRTPSRAEAPRAPAPRPVERAPAAEPPITQRVGRAATSDWASPEAVLRGFYVALNLGDLVKAREFYTRSAASVTAGAGAAAFESWAKRETLDGTITDLRLLEAVNEAEGTARVEIAFADAQPARRRVVFKREGEGWKIERVESVS